MENNKNPNLISGHCELFGGFGYGVQFVLALVSFGSLVIKRHFENPRRSLRIWFLDCSKQGMATMFLHFVNLFIAVLMTKQNEDDACIWYLINILLDTSIGIVLIWILIKLVNSFAQKKNLDFLISGNYFKDSDIIEDDYNIDYKVWAFQAIMYLVFSLIAKTISFGVQMIFPKQLDRFGKYMVSSISVYPRLELITVMIIIPLITTCLQFWLIDNLLKESNEHKINRASLLKISPLNDLDKMKSNDQVTNNSKIFSNSSSSDVILGMKKQRENIYDTNI